MLSRLSKAEDYKGHREVIRAWPRVLQSSPGAELWVVGDGDLRNDLERLANELGLEKQVHFRGRLEGIVASVTPLPPPFVAVTLEGEGHATQLGHFDVSSSIVANEADGTAVGTYEFTAANGDTLTADFTSQVTPTDVPGVVPVLWGRQATQQSRLPTGVSGLFKVRSIGTSESIPFRGPSGVLIDFTAFVRSASQVNSDTLVYVWARSDTPQSILDQLAARGLANPDTEAAAKSVLDQDAFALALRLYVVVTVLVILLALAGLAANLAVQLPARRRDAASLRVVGVKRRSVMLGVVAEFVVVLGAAALAGVAAGGLAQYVVVRTVTLGFVDTAFTPRVLPSFDLTSAVTLSLLVLVGLVVAASAFAFLTVRGARTSSLRENAR